jgi:hypothetical protein
LLALAGGAVLLAGCGSGATATGQHRSPHVVRRVAPAAAVVRHGRVVVRLGAGRATRTVSLHEPAGEIRLYRLRSPAGTRVRATVRLPGLTVPLWIGTDERGPNIACARGVAEVSCTEGEEACPMPAGMWRVRITKLAGPPAAITVWFRVGDHGQPTLA